VNAVDDGDGPVTECVKHIIYIFYLSKGFTPILLFLNSWKQENEQEEQEIDDRHLRMKKEGEKRKDQKWHCSAGVCSRA
jgi:hypothetical protein